jgi:hypothetical protein
MLIEALREGNIGEKLKLVQKIKQIHRVIKSVDAQKLYDYRILLTIKALTISNSSYTLLTEVR